MRERSELEVCQRKTTKKMIERLQQQQLPCIHAQRFVRGKINFTHSEKSKTARLA
jgi:hypothetical protein